MAEYNCTNTYNYITGAESDATSYATIGASIMQPHASYKLRATSSDLINFLYLWFCKSCHFYVTESCMCSPGVWTPDR